MARYSCTLAGLFILGLGSFAVRLDWVGGWDGDFGGIFL